MVATHYAPGLIPLLRPVAGLILDPHNARSHPERNLDSIKESLTRFGQQKPIVVSPEGVVLAGNGTLAAAQALGWTQIAVLVTNLAGPDARGYALADNRSSELAEWDVARLIEELNALPDGMAYAIGWDEGEMRRVAHEAEQAIAAMQADLQDDVVPEPPAVPTAKRGDLWLLGKHRLLCGDSTNAEDVARLMNGEKSSLCASDPPYLVDYTGGDHPQSFHNKPDVKDKHWDAYVDPETSVAFFEGYLRLALAHCHEGTAFYQWHAHRRQDLVDAAWKSLGLLRHQQIIWTKSRPVLTRSHLLWAHEPCVYGWLEGFPPRLRPPTNETTVWAIDHTGAAGVDHPTVKPLEIFARPIRWHTLTGEICHEPFSGSGTQIVAAEKLERRCYAMELSPAFVDVAVQRWEALTGRKAERA
jgi:DNA modification methylase